VKVREIENSKIAIWCGADAITLYPFIFYAMRNPPTSMRVHEHIHVLQVRKLGWIKFYLTYLLYYLHNRFKMKMSADDAYENIPYEMEAYAHQIDWAEQIIAQFPEIKLPIGGSNGQ